MSAYEYKTDRQTAGETDGGEVCKRRLIGLVQVHIVYTYVSHCRSPSNLLIVSAFLLT